jgi:hypothetical protein
MYSPCCRPEHIFVLQQELQLVDSRLSNTLLLGLVFAPAALLPAVKLRILKLVMWLIVPPMPSVWRTKPPVRVILHSALGAFSRRLRSRLGAPKAITATAHKIVRIFYRLGTSGGDYQDSGLDYYEQRYQERIVNNLQKKAHPLGYQLVPQQVTEMIS